MRHAIVGLMLTAMVAMPGAASAGLSRDVQARILAAHNAARAEVGVPAMHWDDRLAADAEPWARHLAQLGALVHSGPDRGAGENLWMGSHGYFAVEQMVGGWTAEKAAFRRARRWEDDFSHVGHYTQMVWRSSTAVGCAIASNAQFDVLVCRYAPQGNVMGQNPY
jgi:hypothetical protein